MDLHAALLGIDGEVDHSPIVVNIVRLSPGHRFRAAESVAKFSRLPVPFYGHIYLGTALARS